MGWEVGSGVAVVVVVVVVVVVDVVASVSGAVLTHGNTKLEGRVKHIILVHNIDHAYPNLLVAVVVASVVDVVASVAGVGVAVGLVVGSFESMNDMNIHS